MGLFLPALGEARRGNIYRRARSSWHKYATRRMSRGEDEKERTECEYEVGLGGDRPARRR